MWISYKYKYICIIKEVARCALMQMSLCVIMRRMGGEVSEYMQTARCLRWVPASFRIVCARSWECAKENLFSNLHLKNVNTPWDAPGSRWVEARITHREKNSLCAPRFLNRGALINKCVLFSNCSRQHHIHTFSANCLASVEIFFLILISLLFIARAHCIRFPWTEAPTQESNSCAWACHF